MMARGADLVGAGTTTEGGLGGNQHLVATALDGRAQNLLGRAVRIDVGGVEHVQTRLKAEIDQAFGLGDIGTAPSLEQFAPTAEGTRAQGQDGNFEA